LTSEEYLTRRREKDYINKQTLRKVQNT